MAEEGESGGGGGEDPRIEMLQQYCLKTMKQVSEIVFSRTHIFNVCFKVAGKSLSGG